MLIDGNELRDAPPVRETEAERKLISVREWYTACGYSAVSPADWKWLYAVLFTR